MKSKVKNARSCREGAAGSPWQHPACHHTASLCVTSMPALPAQEHPAWQSPSPKDALGEFTPCIDPCPMALPYAGVPLPAPSGAAEPSLVLPCPHGSVSEQDAQGTFCCSSPARPGCQSSDGSRWWGKPTCSVCKAPSSLAHALLPPPNPRATPWTPTCARCRLGAAGCIGRVVIATLPNSCAKGHGSAAGRAAGELEDQAAVGGEGCWWDMGSPCVHAPWWAWGMEPEPGCSVEPPSARRSVELRVFELRIIQQNIKCW